MKASPPSTVRVLYVDDSPFDRALVRDALEVEDGGFELTEAATRDELEGILESHRDFDLVLSDFNILGMTGLDVLEMVREMIPGIPIIIVTGTGSEEIAVQALKAGADDYVIKHPNHIRRLPQTIRAVLEARTALKERDRARSMLEESEFRFRLLAEHSMDLIFRLDRAGRILYLSPASMQMLAVRPESMLGRPFLELVYPDDRELVADALPFPIDEAGTPLEAGPLPLPPFRLVGEGREPRWVEVRGRVVPETLTISGERELQLACRDVTDRKEMEDSLRVSRNRLNQLRHLESVGRLAGGIAHDFNNLLTVIFGSTEMIRSSLGEDHPLEEEIEEIRSAAQRAGELTRHLLEFSSGEMAPLDEVDLRALLAETEPLLRRALGEGIRLEFELPGGLPPVRSNPARLQQVLINLGLNARDAIQAGGSGGTVRLVVDEWLPDPHPDRAGRPDPSGGPGRVFEDSHLVPWLPGRGAAPLVRIQVSDDGCGMPPEVVERAFEPFYTTKEFGKGTGLGLASSFGTVRQAGGTILVESEPSIGSTFTVLLPIGRSVPEEREEEP